MKLSVFLMVLVVLVLLFVTAPVVADSGEVAGVPAVSAATELDQAAEMIFKAVYAVVFIPMAAPLVTTLTSGLKAVPFLQRFGSPVLAFGLNVIVWVVYQALNQAGYGGYFDSVIDAATTIATLVIAVFGTQVVSGRMYDEAKAHGVPVLGYQRRRSAVG